MKFAKGEMKICRDIEKNTDVKKIGKNARENNEKYSQKIPEAKSPFPTIVCGWFMSSPIYSCLRCFLTYVIIFWISPFFVFSPLQLTLGEFASFGMFFTD